MKKILFLLISSFILISCKPGSAEIDLLENLSKWSASEELIFEGGVLKIEGEFKTAIYQSGAFSTFENFELKARIRTQEGACAELIFHTGKKEAIGGYAVRIDNSPSGNWDKLLKTGSLSQIRNVQYKMVSDEEWFDLRMKVLGNRIEIYINDYPVVNYVEPEVPFRTSDTEGRKLGSGTFAITTLYEHTSLEISRLEVTALKLEELSEVEDIEFTRLITHLNIRNLPVVDYHVHEKGDLTMDALLQRSADKGINYGIAANCGLKFPIQTDEELDAYLKSIDGLPIFKAMQAEGREWVDMFSPELVAGFDYAFTDAMTWTNRNGTRMRLWIPEETEVGDPENFMDQLVAQIEKVVTEPVAIYVNPTYLPEEIEGDYEKLWTDERILRVVTALRDNNVALEINSRLQLPGDRVIAMAQKAGVKFALGTNNTDAENLGELRWALEKVAQHELQPSDMFLPVGR